MSLTDSTDREVMLELGRRLRSLRERRGWTSQDAAQATKLSRRTLYRAERGQNPTLQTLVRLLRLYGELDSLAAIAPEPEVSPMDLLRSPKRRRKDAHGAR